MQSVKRAFVWLCQAFLSLVAESRYRRAVRELQAWDSRSLADIGISRGEIDFRRAQRSPAQVGWRPASGEQEGHDHSVSAGGEPIVGAG